MSDDVTTGQFENITNATIGPPEEKNRTEFLVLTCIVAPLSFFGNILIIICFIKEKKLRFFGNYFLISLATADMISGLVVAVYADYALSDIWRFGHEVCLILMVVDETITMCSSWTLALISLDRVWNITFPIIYKLKTTISLAMKLLVIPWITAFCCWGLPILLWNPISGNDIGPDWKCVVPFSDSDEFKAFLHVMSFYIPFILITISNILILVVVIKRSSKLKLSFFKDFTKIRKQKRDVRSARALALLVIVFLITWAPFEILSIVDPICDGCVSAALLWGSYYLVWFNSAINPFLYPMMQKQMRETLWSLFCGKKKVNQVVPFYTEASKAKHILVKGYEEKVVGKLGIPVFMGENPPSYEESYKKEPVKDKKVPIGDNDQTKEEIKVKPEKLSKNDKREPPTPYYLKGASRARINQVQPLPRSKYLSRDLPSSPTKKRKKLLKRGKHKSEKNSHKDKARDD